MSAHSPDELKAQRERLASAGRSEVPDPNAAAAGLEALLRGDVESWGVEGPPKRRGGARWARRGLTLAGPAVLVAAWWLWQADRQPQERAIATPTVASGESNHEQPGPPAADSPSPSESAAPSAPPPPTDAPAAPVEPRAETPAPPTQQAPKRAGGAANDEEDALARELKLLDQARRHLPAEPQAALDTLAGYGRSFPQGSMRVEAEVVRIEALLKLGRRAEAQKRAAKLMAADREGLLRERVQTLLDAAP